MRETKWLHGIGIEIGAHNIPIKDIRPIYVDRFFEFAGVKCLVDVISEASFLPFRENSLDYIASSHLFEHLPNPILTLLEWYKILKPGGIIFMIVPDRRFTFDHHRERTSLSHIIEDFEKGITACDPTHIEEFVKNVDMSMMRPHIESYDIPKAKSEYKKLCQDTIRAGKEISIHFHVFEKDDVIGLIEFMKRYEKTRLSWNIIEVREKYPPERGDGFLLVIKVEKIDSKSISEPDNALVNRESTYRKKKKNLLKKIGNGLTKILSKYSPRSGG